MARIALLTLIREDELRWRKTLTSYFRETGDYLSYALFPSIVLSSREDIDGEIAIGDGVFCHSSEPEHNGFCWVLPLKGLEGGLFLTRAESICPYSFPEGRVTVQGAALVEAGESSFRVIRQRPLLRGRAR